ncbi:MAG: alpha/beta hydrolase, partial [Planctomycetota bacterium]|nr:alpha/beta hydrolase [Planctomycetota bacterium]
VPPLPYAEVEAEVATPAGHVLAGTLVIPGTDPDENGFPAVVLVTGSGPQNRDEELLGHRPFLVLADRLARMGIASFRYDDRGVGASTGEFSTATGFDLADDAAAALGYLKRAPGVDCDRCGVVGHSEGGLLAAIVAAGMAPSFPEAAPAFVVSIAGTGVDGGAIMSDQSARILRAAGADEDAIRDVDAAHRALMDAMRNEEVESTVIEPLLAELQDRQLALQGVELDEADLAELRRAGMASMGSPWMRAFIRFDPAVAWRSVRVPVLAVNGTLDLQVWHDLNLPAIERAVRDGGGAVEIVRFEGLNHMLQPTTTGSPDEYAIIDTTMDEAAMESIGSWVLSTPRRPEVPNRGGE